MKRIVSFLLAAVMFFSLTACSQADGSEAFALSNSGQYEMETAAEYFADEGPTEDSDAEGEGTGNSNIFIAYFS